MPTTHKAKADRTPVTESCTFGAAPVPGTIVGIDEALGPVGIAVAPALVPVPAVAPA